MPVCLLQTATIFGFTAATFSAAISIIGCPNGFGWLLVVPVDERYFVVLQEESVSVLLARLGFTVFKVAIALSRMSV